MTLPVFYYCMNLKDKYSDFKQMHKTSGSLEDLREICLSMVDLFLTCVPMF